MEPRAIIHHSQGTLAIVGDQVVVHQTGTARRLFGSPKPWSVDLELPVRRCWVRSQVTDDYLRELTILDGDRPWQAVSGVDRVELEAFVRELAGAKSADSGTVELADCGSCGAPSQLAGHGCAYCGRVVRPPARSTIASASAVSGSIVRSSGAE